jgi:hypothetical protein
VKSSSISSTSSSASNGAVPVPVPVSVSAEKRVVVAGSSQIGPSVKSSSISSTSSSTSNGAVPVPVSVSATAEKRVVVAGSSQIGPSVKSSSISSSCCSFGTSVVSTCEFSSKSFFSSSKKAVIRQPVSRSGHSNVAITADRIDYSNAGPGTSLLSWSEQPASGISLSVFERYSTLSSASQESERRFSASNSDCSKSFEGECERPHLPSAAPQVRKQKRHPSSDGFGDRFSDGREFSHTTSITNGSSHSTAFTSTSSSSAETNSVNGTLLDVLRKRKREVRLKTIGSSRSRFLSPPFRYLTNIPCNIHAA